MPITPGVAEQARTRHHDDRGFTLIELLVVVVIIGILAAIAVPVFLGQQNAAHNAVATSNLANARMALVVYSLDHDGAFTSNTDALVDYGFINATTAAPSITVRNQRFCVEVVSESSDSLYATDRTTPAVGTCATSGDSAFAAPRRDRGNRVPGR